MYSFYNNNILTILLFYNDNKVKFLFQQISVLIQRFNSVLFHETFPVEDNTDT